MCMSLLDIILVFLFLYMYTILQRQKDQFWVSFLIIHLIKIVRQVYAYILACWNLLWCFAPGPFQLFKSA